MAILCIVSAGIAFGQRARKGDNEALSDMKQREAEFYFIEGEKYYILEDYAKALVYFQRVAEIQPDNATVFYKIAEVLSQSNRPDDLTKSASSIEQAIKLDKSNKYFYLLASGIYSGLGKLDQAEAAYEALIQNVEGTDSYLLDLAALYQYDSKDDQAIKTYNRAEAKFGVNETGSLQKQKIYLKQGKIDAAIAEGQKLADTFPEEEKYAVGYADVLARNGKKQEAIAKLENVVSENADFWSARMLLAGLYRETGRENDAEKLLTQIFNSPEADVRNKIVTLSTYNNELSESTAGKVNAGKAAFAVTLFNTLVQEYPDEETVRVLGGDLFLSIDSVDQAIGQYEKAIDLGANHFEVWQNLISLELQENRFHDVVQHTDKALELYPNQSILYYLNGYANLMLKDYQAAIASLEEARKRLTNDNQLQGQVNSLLGDAYNATGDYEKSDSAYETALEANPDNDIVLNNYSYYLALRKHNLERAEKLAGQLIKNNPDNPTYLDTYAWVLYMRDKYKEARKVMERAISTGKASATHFEHYGDILFRLGDVDGAVVQWQKARDLNDTSELLDKKIANRKIYEQ